MWDSNRSFLTLRLSNNEVALIVPLRKDFSKDEILKSFQTLKISPSLSQVVFSTCTNLKAPDFKHFILVVESSTLASQFLVEFSKVVQKDMSRTILFKRFEGSTGINPAQSFGNIWFKHGHLLDLKTDCDFNAVTEFDIPLLSLNWFDA